MERVPPPVQSMKPKMLKFYLELFLNAWILKIYYLEVFFCLKTLSFGNILGGGGSLGGS